MKSIITTLIERWNALQRRERIVVVTGGALVLLLALFLLLSSILDENRALQARKAALLADIRWMAEQSALIARLGNSCPPGSSQLGSGNTVLQNLSKRAGLQSADWQGQGSERYRLKMDKVDANRLLQLTYQVACEGFVVDKIEIARLQNDSEQTRGLLEVHRVN